MRATPNWKSHWMISFRDDLEIILAVDFWTFWPAMGQQYNSTLRIAAEDFPVQGMV